MDTEVLAPIRLTIETPADPTLAWSYLVDPDRVAEWFTEATPLGSVGDPYRLDFGEGSVVEGRIVGLDDGRSFSHSWAWEDAGPGEETIVTWIVEPLDDRGSRITLIHDGWAESGADDAMRDDHEAYWSGYLDDLRDLLEDVAAG
jgi:uncharacterized protein YndB with AHSA1/START domain